MNDFEDRIRKLPWREPSAELRERIFVPLPEYPRVSRRAGVSWKWAAALTAAAGIGGFLAGTFLAPTQDREVVSAATEDVDMQVVETSSKRNSFDFSSEDVQILPGEFIAYIDTEEGER